MHRFLGVLLAALVAPWGCSDEGEDPCADVEDGCDLEGDRRCTIARDAVESCQQGDDGCAVWVVTASCGDHQTCSQASCECAEACGAEGERRCSSAGDAIESCVADDDGCLGWSEPEPCASGCDDSGGEPQCAG